MRIVYIITRMDELGGPQIHIRDFAMRLTSMGHDVHVIAGSSGSIADFLRTHGVPCYIVPEMTRSIGLFREVLAYKCVRHLLKKIQPDLVSCHSSKAGVIGRLAAWAAGVPVIFTVHGWAFTENIPEPKRTIYRMIEWVMAQFCRRIITVSDYDRSLGLKARVARADKMITVHNGMPDYPQNRIQNHDQNIRLIMVARFAEQKDHQTLVDAVATIRDLPWTLSLVGNGDASVVQAQVEKLNLQGRVHILGQRSDVGDLLNASDIFLLITHWEGFPRSIVEAMRAGLPTIATSVAGVPESVRDGQTGYLVARGDTQMVAAAIADLIKNPERREGMGLAARARYVENFTFDHMFDKTITVYQDVTGLAIYPLVVDNMKMGAVAA